MRLVSLISSAVCLLGCAVQPAPVSDSPESNTKVSAYAASQAEQNEEERTVAESLLPQTEDGGDTSESSVAPERAGAENTDKAAKKQPVTAAPKEPAIPAPAPEDKPAPTPTPAPTQKPAEKQGEQPAPKPEPAPTPKPAASGDIYSIAEAVRAGNEYAKVQCGVTIDTGLTAENTSYFPGTADSVAWLAANGGQEALNRAVRGNVDATFQYLAAMDSADAVRAYARFNCTVRYSAASDEYIVVVLYG